MESQQLVIILNLVSVLGWVHGEWTGCGSSLDGVPNHKLTYSTKRTTTNLGESIFRDNPRIMYNIMAGVGVGGVGIRGRGGVWDT